MKIKKFLPLIFLFLIISFFFRSIFIQGKIPIPTDTLVNLFNPYRDYYANAYPRGVPYKNPLVGDPVLQQIPWRNLSIEQIKKGQLPLWNPYQMAGYPLLGNIQSAPFYPLNLLFFILPFIGAWTIFIMLQPVLAGIFMFYYLKNRKVSNEGSLFGALAFSFCGFFIAWLEWGTIVHTALWLPLSLLSIDKALKTKEKKWLLVLAFSICSSYLAGHLQTFIYSLLLIVGYLVFFYSDLLKKSQIFLSFGLTFLVSLLILIPIWLPQLKLLGLSARNVDQSWLKEGWFIPLPQLFQFIAPDFFGNPATGNYWGVFNYGEFVGYIGIAPLIFALIALLKKKKEVWFWGGVSIISLLFASQNAFSELPYRLAIPFIASTQPTRLVFLADVALSILAAFGFDYIFTANKKELFSRVSSLLISIVVIVSGSIFFLYHNSNGTNLSIAQHNLIVPLGLLVSIFGMLCLNFFLDKKKRYILSIIFIIITAGDLLFFAGKYTPFSEQKYFYPETKSINFLKNNSGNFRVMTTDRQILSPNISTMYHIQSVDGYDPLYLLRFGEFASALGRNKPDISAPFGFNRIVVPTEVNSRLVNLLGVKYVLSLTERSDPQLIKVFQEGQTRIYENKNVFPRAFFVKQIITATSKDEAIHLLFDPLIDLRTEAIVEDTSLDGQSFLDGAATINSYNENKIVINTSSEGQSFLVLTDTFYPTWKVTIDNLPSKIIRTDFNFRGVVVPKGSHTVEFKDTLL